MKDEILQKSLEYFQKHGIREMSNQKLVELLGISTKTIYRYFKNKEELLEEVLYLHHALQQEMVRSLPRGRCTACFFFDIWYTAVMGEYDVNDAFFKDLNYYYPELAKKIETTIRTRWTKEFLVVINRGIEDGSFRKDIVPEVVLENIYAQYETIARSDRFKQFGLSPGKIMLNTIGATIRGICTLPGVKALGEHIPQNYQLPAKGKMSMKKASAGV